RRPTPPLFPYTTLFRSRNTRELRGDREVVEVRALTPLGWVEREASATGLGRRDGSDDHATEPVGVEGRVQWPGCAAVHLHVVRRSEEHTSELQSRENLV